MARGQWGGFADRHPMQVRITWTNGTNQHQTGFYLRSAGVNVTSPDEVTADVEAWVRGSFRTLLAADQRVLGIDVVDMVTFEGGGSSPNDIVGTMSLASDSSKLPGALAAVINLKGELRTRYGQGRMFWPIVSESHVDKDIMNNTAVTLFQGVIDALATRFTGNSVSGHNLICVHGVIPPRGATPTRPARDQVPPMWYDVTTLRLNTFVTFLRSRKAGVGS